MSLAVITKPLLVLYLLIATSYMKDLYGGQFKDMLAQDRMLQHLIGFIGMLVLINLISGVDNIKDLVLYSFVGYLWFILSTKLNIYWNLALFGLLTIAFLFETNMSYKEDQLDDDENLTTEITTNIKSNNNRTKLLMGCSILALTFVGVGIYMNRKVIQYGGDFDLTRFFVSGRNR